MFKIAAEEIITCQNNKLKYSTTDKIFEHKNKMASAETEVLGCHYCRPKLAHWSPPSITTSSVPTTIKSSESKDSTCIYRR